MGLNAALDDPLDILENETASSEIVGAQVERVLTVCKEALGEAGMLYRQFQNG